MQSIVDKMIYEHNAYTQSVSFSDNAFQYIYVPIIFVTIIIIIHIIYMIYIKKKKSKWNIKLYSCILIGSVGICLLYNGIDTLSKKHLHNDFDKYVATTMSTNLTQKGVAIVAITNTITPNDGADIDIDTKTKTYTPKTLIGLQYAAINDELVKNFGINTTIDILQHNNINYNNNLSMNFVHKANYYTITTYRSGTVIKAKIQ